MMLNLKNALRCAKTVNFVVLASCALIFSPNSAYASSHCTTPATRSYDAGGGDARCADATSVGGLSEATANSATAMGVASRAGGANSVAFGSNANATHAEGVAMGYLSRVFANRGTAVGSQAYALHERGSAFGYRAQTTAADQMVFGTAGGSSPDGTNVWADTSYRFAGLNLAGAGTRFLSVDAGGFLAAANTASLAASLGTELGIGTASQDADGSGTIYERLAVVRAYDTRIDGNTTRIATSERTISDLDTRLTARADTNAAGVAMGFALSAVDTHIPDGKKLTLGIGGGSFDGKSAVAIGVAAKWGASKVNAAASSGDGESGLRVGISWSW